MKLAIGRRAVVRAPGLRRLLAAGALAATAAAVAPAAGAAQLPPELHYELVSPLASNGFDFTRAWLFRDGVRGAIGSEVSDVNGVFTVRRTAAGWERAYRQVTPPNATPLIAPATIAVSDDLSRIVSGGVKPGSMYFTPDELALSTPNGWRTIGGPLRFVEGTADLRRVVVQLGLGVDRSELFPDFPGPHTDVYVWEDDGSDDGALTAVGADIPRLVQCGGESPDGDGRRGPQSGVSADARIVLLSSRADCVDPDSFESIPRHVYLWRDGEGTVDISAPPSGPDGQTDVVGHTADLGSVFLRSALAFDPADANDAPDVYRYDVADGTYTRLTGVATDAGETLQSAAASDDGSRIWFATEQGADATLWTAARGAAPSAIEVAVGGADPIDPPFDLRRSEFGARLPTQLTADGETIVWTTRKPLDGVGGSIASDVGQLFRATADGAVDCITCAADGAPAENVEFGDVLMTLQVARQAISDDGRWIWFQTKTPLDPGDRNDLDDVYAWHDGTLHLVSAGDERFGATLAGVSRDGDAFFKTNAQLLPWIDDDHLKVYAARHGDGLPAPADPRESCLGDGCQGEPGPRVDHPRDPSETYTGPGNADDPAPRFPANPAIAVARPSRAAQRRLARGGALTIAVRANTPGRLSATVRYKAGRRWLRSKGASRTLKRAGTARLTLRLSRAARGRLARRGALRVRIDVAHGQVAQTRRLTFVLKRPAPTRRGADA